MKQDRLERIKQEIRDRHGTLAGDVTWLIEKVEKLRERNEYLKTERDLLRMSVNVVCKERDDATRALKDQS